MSETIKIHVKSEPKIKVIKEENGDGMDYVIVIEDYGWGVLPV